MKKIFIVLNDNEVKSINSIFVFVKMKYGVKKALIHGILDLAEKTANNEKMINEIKELKKRIGIL